MLKRIGNLIRGFVGLFVSGLEKQNPEALIEVEKENLRKQISEFNKGLAAHAGLCERLISQGKALERNTEELRAKTLAHLQAGNREPAGRLAYRLKESLERLEETREQLQRADQTYQELVRTRGIAVNAAREKIEALKRDVDDLRMKKAIAELNEMAAGLVGELGGSGDTLERLHQMVREERDKAAGRTRVARESIGAPDLQVLETEQKALEELALADFAAAAGIALETAKSRSLPDGSPGDSASERSM